jgi:hypothetical protein
VGLMQTWGLGAELVFGAGNANLELGRTRRAVMALKSSFSEISGTASRAAGELGKVALALTPITLGFGYLVTRGSELAQQLEGQKLTMEVLLGSASKATKLIGMLRQNAAVTPFGQADVIEGSKSLLRITGDNISANMKLLKTVETLAALNPGRSVAETSQAVLMGTSGTFDSLRSMGIVIDAQAMSAAGAVGGKAYTDAVVQAITTQLASKTRGLDLVGRLGQTFAGRMSTLHDTIDNVIENIGEKINSRVGPAIDFLTAKINDTTQSVLEAVDRIGDKFDAFRSEHIDPLYMQFQALWTGLGTEGQVAVFAFLLGFAALATVGTAVGSVLGVVGFAITGIVGAVGALLGLLAPEVFLPILGVMLAVGAAVGLVGGIFVAAFKRPDDTWYSFLTRLWTGVSDFAALIRDTLMPDLLAFTAGFLTGLGSSPGQAFDAMGAAVRGAWLWVTTLFEYMMPMVGHAGKAFLFLGYVIGQSVRVGLDILSAGIVFLIKGFEGIYSIMQPLIAAVYEFVGGFVDLITGSTNADKAISRMLSGIVGGIMAVVFGVVSLFLTGISQILRAVSVLVSAIPGAATVLGWTGNLGSDGILDIQRDLSDQLTNAILSTSVQKSNADREQARADQLNAHVDNKVDVNVNASMKVDSKEIARTNGDAAVISGERGTGPKLPTEQRGRVLRRGLEVTPLKPTEVL